MMELKLSDNMPKSNPFIQSLRKENQDLNKEIQTLNAQLKLFQQRCEQYAQAYESLQHQIKELLRHRFGSKSERFIDPENPQLSLFDDLHNAFSTADQKGQADTSPTPVKIAAHERRNSPSATSTKPLPCPAVLKSFLYPGKKNSVRAAPAKP
jgi:DNA repair ATPase RecN